jgi:predicted ester cyclase
VFARLHRVFPDLHITVEDLIAERDKVAPALDYRDPEKHGK